MHNNLRIGLAVAAIIAVSVGVSVLVMWKYFYREVVVIDIKELVAYEQNKIRKLDKEEAIKEVGTYFEAFSKSISQRKELILIKEAVQNADSFKDITPEYKK